MAAAEWQEEQEGERRRKVVVQEKGELVLLRRFEVARSYSMTQETRWEGPFR